MIHFAQPYWIVAGLVVCSGGVVFFRIMDKRRQVRMQAFASAHLLVRLTGNVSPHRRLLKKGLWLVALFCCFLALARPQYGFTMVDVKRKGIDILFALDSSKSMLTEDIRPNRLERTKLAVLDFIGRLEGDRVGLLPFAGTAFLSCPLTIDYNAFADSLTSVDTSIIPRGGTDLAAAIDLADLSLADSGNHKILVLLTDGENLEGDAVAAAAKAAKNGMIIFTVGVGTSEGELIPLPTSVSSGQFVKDGSGALITSRLDEKTLTAIAEAAGGMYAPLGDNGEGLDRIYQQKLSLLPKKELMEKLHKQAVERFGWALGLALLLLMIEYMISGRKDRLCSDCSSGRPFILTVGRRMRQAIGRKPLTLLLLVAGTGVNTAVASLGEEAWAAGDFLVAQEVYAQALKERPDDPRVHYNAGTTAYKNNLFDEAISSFQRALQSDDLHLQGRSYYNLGNALFKKGEEGQLSSPQQTEKLWQQALDAFDGSMQLNPQDTHAKENRALVAQKLEEFKKQQQEKKQEEKEQKSEKNDQQQEGQEEKKEQGQQSSDDQQGQEGQQQQSAPSESQGQEGHDQKNSSDQNTAPTPEDTPDEHKETTSQTQTESSPQEHAKETAQEASPTEGQENQGTEKGAAAVPSPTEAGKMTPEEARQLLHRLKAVEGTLNFVPQTANGKGEKERTWKDW